MSPKVELPEESSQKVAPRAEEFVADFYGRLFTMVPEVQHLFKDTEMKAQRENIVGALVMVMKNFRNTKVLSMALQDLGRRHEEKGVEQEHCPMVGAALLETFAAFLGEKWTPEVQQAWTDAYNAIASLMYEGYESSKEAA